MKNYSILFLLVGSSVLGACSTAANNGSTANMRGTNTNTGYVMNSETNVKPSMPVNATNISPPSMNSVMGNGNTRMVNGNTSRNPSVNANGMKK